MQRHFLSTKDFAVAGLMVELSHLPRSRFALCYVDVVGPQLLTSYEVAATTKSTAAMDEFMRQ